MSSKLTIKTQERHHLRCSGVFIINLLTNTKQHITNFSKGLDELNSKCDNVLVIGDLNSEMSEPSLEEFCQTYNLESIVNKLTSFKNLRNPSCIDLVLTNTQESFSKPKPLKLS